MDKNHATRRALLDIAEQMERYPDLADGLGKEDGEIASLKSLVGVRIGSLYLDQHEDAVLSGLSL